MFDNFRADLGLSTWFLMILNTGYFNISLVLKIFHACHSNIIQNISLSQTIKLFLLSSHVEFFIND